MSREWYIRTDTRHIQDTFGDIDTTPLTLAEKWRQNRKKIIIGTLGAMLGILLFVFTFPFLFPKNTADYTVTIATQTTLSAKAQTALQEALSACGEDRNGDGKVEIVVRALAVGLAEDGERNIPLEQLIITFQNDAYTLLAMESSVYERYVLAYTAEDAVLFAPLSSGETLFAQDKTADCPALLWGVRALPVENENATAHLALLKQYINDLF